jgi:hypothetical protein
MGTTLTPILRLSAPSVVASSSTEFANLVYLPGEAQGWLLHLDSCRFSQDLRDLDQPSREGFLPPSCGFQALPTQQLARDGISAYPSPSLTGSQASSCVPLPYIPSQYADTAGGGILDSPLVLRRLTQFPLSPPPTIPTPVHDLPPSDSNTVLDRGDDASISLSPESVCLPLPDAESPEILSSPVGGSNGPQRQNTQLLSPLSPEWDHAGISECPARAEGQPHLSDLPSPLCDSILPLPTDDNPRPLFFDGSPPANFRSAMAYRADSDTLLSPRSSIVIGATNDVDETAEYLDPDDLDDSVGSMQDLVLNSRSLSCGGCAHSGGRISHWQPTPWHSLSSHPDPIVPDEPPETHRGDPMELQLDLCEFDRSTLHLLNTQQDHHPLSTIHGDSEDDQRDRASEKSSMDIDHFDPPRSFLSASPPLVHSNPVDDDEFFPDPDPEYHTASSTLCSPKFCGSAPLPVVHEREGIAIDSPLPSRRLTKELPALSSVDEVYSPPQTLLSLPGIETDDELLPPFSSELSIDSFSLTPSEARGLLLIDDANDFFTPRSPSPEDFDIDIDLDGETYPEFEQLCELSKRSNSLERAARQLENQLWEQGDVHARNETRRMRKLEKEKGREIGALLRLKLGKETVGNLDNGRSSKKVITSLPRLVARMIFRRREISRPLANRRIPAHSPNTYTPTSLSRVVSSEDVWQ